MNIDIVIPTYKRKVKLDRLLKSIPNQDNLRIWIYCDNNDMDSYYHFKMNPRCTCLCMDKKYQAFGIWNYHLLNNFKADIMCYLCDDTEVFENTFNNVIKHFEDKFKNTDGMVTLKQANMQGSDSAMGCIGKYFAFRYLNRQCFCPNFVSFYADTELGDFAKKLNKFHYGEDCLINHYHPAIFKDEMDATHGTIRGNEKNIDIKVNAIRREKNLLWGESIEQINRETIN